MLCKRGRTLYFRQALDPVSLGVECGAVGVASIHREMGWENAQAKDSKSPVLGAIEKAKVDGAKPIS